MLWTAPPPGTRVPRKWALLKLSRFGGASHANGYDNRSRHREVGFSGPRHRRGGQGCHPPSVEAPLRPSVLPEASALSDWHRSLCRLASLVACLYSITSSARASNDRGISSPSAFAVLRFTETWKCD